MYLCEWAMCKCTGVVLLPSLSSSSLLPAIVSVWVYCFPSRIPCWFLRCLVCMHPLHDQTCAQHFHTIIDLANMNECADVWNMNNNNNHNNQHMNYFIPCKYVCVVCMSMKYFNRVNLYSLVFMIFLSRCRPLSFFLSHKHITLQLPAPIIKLLKKKMGKIMLQKGLARYIIYINMAWMIGIYDNGVSHIFFFIDLNIFLELRC